MSRPVLECIGRAAGLLDCTTPSHEPEAAAELLAAGAAVAELVDAVRWLQRLRAIGNSTRESEASDAVNAALAKVGGAT